MPSNPPGQTKLWPASLPEQVHSQPLGSKLTWTMAPVNITPFIAVETTYGIGAAKVTRRCVLKSSLNGAIDGRRQDPDVLLGEGRGARSGDRQGDVVAMPTDTFYGLAVDPVNLHAVENIYRLKSRQKHKPLSLLISSECSADS